MKHQFVLNWQNLLKAEMEINDVCEKAERHLLVNLFSISMVSLSMLMVEVCLLEIYATVHMFRHELSDI